MHIQTARPASPQIPPPLAAATGERVILLVEDDLAMADCLKSMLSTLDSCQILHAPNGHGANDILRARTVDLVLTDILMPEMDGMEVIRFVREKLGALPVVAMTGGGRRLPGLDLVRYAELLGADKAMSKPVNPQALLTLLDELLPKRA